MEQSYVLHFPFKWLHEFETEDFEGVSELEPDVRFQLKKTVHGDSEIILSKLPNRPFAESCIYRCWFALMCFSILHYRPCAAELSLVEPEPIQPESKEILGQLFNSDLSEMDSKVIGAVAYIRSSTQRVKRLKMTITGTVKGDTVNVATELMKWIWHPRFHELINDKKLRLAMELSNLVGHEAPKEARFILIMSALESLLPESQHPQFVQDKIAEWKAELKVAKSEMATKEEREYLQQLIDKTAFLGSPSITSRLTSFAAAHQTTEDDRDFVKKVKQAYSLRSNLVHQGECDSELLSLVYPSVYKLLFRAIKVKLTEEKNRRIEI